MVRVAPLANPCLTWILDGGEPPFPMQTAQVREAVEWLEILRDRLLRTFLRHPPQTDRYLALVKADRDLLTLQTWTHMTGPYHSPRLQQAFSRLFLAMNDRYVRFWNRLSRKKGAFRVHVLKLRKKLRRAGDTRWEASIEASLGGSGDSTEISLDREMDKLTAKVSRQEAQHGRTVEQEGGVLFAHWPARANPAMEEEARMAALRRQERGFLVYPSEDPGAHLMQHSNDPQVRQRLWETRQTQVCVKPKDIEKMRRLRQRQAEHMEFADHLAYQMSNATIMTPRRAERLMHRSLQQIKPTMTRAARRGERKHKLTPQVAADFGFSFLEGSGRRETPEVSPRAFPWRPTAIKIISELMGLGGWVCQAAPKALGRGNTRMLRFAFRHADGRRAQLWYGPFSPSPLPNSQVGAQACLIRATLSEETDIERICTIDHQVPAGREHFTLYDIQYLCHELGHVLHFLALPGQDFAEVEQTTDDFVEVPSILLQSYYRQPETLMRWMSNKAPKSLRQRSYWTRRLRRDPLHALWYQRSMFRAYLDLQLHRKDAGSLEEVVRQTYQVSPAPLGQGQTDHLNYFDWSALSGMGISHLAGEAMAHRLMPIPENGQIDSQALGICFQELLDVLVRGLTGMKLRRVWRQWRGETMITSMDEGFRTLTRHYGALTRPPARRTH